MINIPGKRYFSMDRRKINYMSSLNMISKFISLLSSGLLAGAFFYAFINVVPTFKDVSQNVHLIFRTALMRHNGITMPVLMVLSIFTSLLFALTVNQGEKNIRVIAFLSGFFALASFLTTRFGNVPINQIIKTWIPEAPPKEWKLMIRRWDFFHYIRTITAFASFVSLLLCSILSK